MKYRGSLIILPALAFLTACQTMTPEDRRARDESECVNYGFKPRTDAFAECLQRIELDRRAKARANAIRADQILWQPPVIIERRVYVRR